MDVAKKYLFFRPATADGDDVLISGSVRGGMKKPLLNPGGQHLACFVGGMVGIGAKVFNRPDDLSTARKLTEGCIWAYQSTPTGIMPEMFQCSPCDDDSTSCKWEPWRWYGTSPPENAQIAKKYREDAHTEKLVPGFVTMIDKRYLLRYGYIFSFSNVFTLITRAPTNSTQTRSHRISIHPLSYHGGHHPPRQRMEHVHCYRENLAHISRPRLCRRRHQQGFNAPRHDGILLDSRDSQVLLLTLQ
jgi:hypothetical protein